MQLELLKKLNFSDKMAKVYLALLSLGPSSVRKLAQIVDLNRGTVYDILKELQDRGVISFYKEATKQYFVAENPEKLRDLVHKQEKDLQTVESELDKIIPELKALHDKGDNRPVARYYHKDELNKILEDVLQSCEDSVDKLYYIYSAEGVREYLYKSFQTFSDVRIAKGIKVKVIAIGEGGELRGLDERKWLKKENKTPTYIIIYPGKTAYISLDAKTEPMGVVIENQGVYEIQKNIFEQLWSNL